MTDWMASIFGAKYEWDRMPVKPRNTLIGIAALVGFGIGLVVG